MTPLQRISEEIERVTSKPVRGGKAHCPAHDDTKASLSIGEGDDGRVLMNCHAGCTFESIMLSLNLDVTDAFPETKSNGLGEIVETYPYTDEGGTLLYEAVRFRPKDFRQRKPDGHGGWSWSLNGTRRVLYRLPKVKEASENGRVVFIVEGEKDVAAIERIGLTATTNPMGADKWRDEYAEALTGAHVVILPDNDDPGRQHAERVAQSLHGKAQSVRIVDLPGLKPKGDVSDWLKAGGTREELQRLAREADLYEPSNDEGSVDPSFQKTDLGNAERFVHDHGDTVRFCGKWGSFIVWDGKRFKPDDTGEAMALAYDTVREMQKEAVEIEDADRRTSAMKYAASCQSASRIRNMVSLAENMRSIAILPEALDRDPWLLNVENGTINLKTGEFGPHRQEHLNTKLAPVEYDPAAKAPRWQRHLMEVSGGDEDLPAYIQRNVGYSATGDVSEQIITIPYGPGANGKGVTVNTIMNVLGDYAQSTRPELLLSKRASHGPSPGEAALKGARFVSTSESGSGQRFDEATVKRLTGGDRIRARFNRQDEFEFDPTHKLWFTTNHKPKIEGTDYAIWRRIHLVPFTVTFTPDKRDTELEEKLKAEASGILNWIIEGCLMWREEGLNPPNAVQQATSEYKSEMDVLAGFLEECCETEIREMEVKASRLYEKYKQWCERTGEKAETQTNFGLRLSERGFQRKRRMDGYWYLGIGVKG